MKALKLFGTFLLMIMAIMFIGCNESKNYDVKTNIPETLKQGEELVLDVKINGNTVSASEYDIYFDDYALEYAGGIITAVEVGSSGFKLMYDGKVVLTGSIEVVSSKVNVTYELNGGEAKNLKKEINYGEVYVLPEATKEDYVFCGWRDENNNVYLQLDNSVTSDIKLFATWHSFDGEGYDIYEIIEEIKKIDDELYIDDEKQLDKAEKYIASASEYVLSYVYNIQKYNLLTQSLNNQKNQISEVNLYIGSIAEGLDNSKWVEKVMAIYPNIPQQNLKYVEGYEKFAAALLEEKNIVIDLDSYIPSKIEDSIVLPLEISGYELTWTTSKENLVIVETDSARLNKAYQSHVKQEVEVIANFKYEGFPVSVSKTITVDAIVYDALPSTPVAAYVNVGALSHYEDCNGRTELFSDDIKETLDIVYYSFITPKSDGSLEMNNSFKHYLPEVLDLKNSGVRVIACLGGGGTSKAFSDIACDNTKLLKYINGIVDIVVEYGFDGVDIDWEYPGSETDRETSVDKANYTKMFKYLREKIDAVQDPKGTKFILSSAIPGSTWGLDRFDVPGMNLYLDYVNIMSYDLNNSAKATHLSPLYSTYNDGGFGLSADWAVSEFVKRGFEKNKLIIGCATYGKVYQLSGTLTGKTCLGKAGTLAQVSGASYSYSSGTIYYYGISKLLEDRNYEIFHDYASGNKLAQSYIFNSTNNIFITYESLETITAKYEYAKANKIGIMCWSIPEDATDTFITAIKNAK